MCVSHYSDQCKGSDSHWESGDSGGGRDWMHLNKGSVDGGSSNRLLSLSQIALSAGQA